MSLWNNPPYYLTAYGLAVKHGYTGTEAQWLESLKGEPGPGITIERTFPTFAKMIAYYATAKPAGFVLVGSSDDYLLYYWDKVDLVWRSIKLKGDNAVGVESFELVSGTHAAGTTDVYLMKLTDGTGIAIPVYNGTDGTGAGDMLKGIYDPDGENKDIFKYVRDKIALLDADAIPTDDTDSVQDHLDDLETDVGNLKTGVGTVANLSGFTATDLTGAANELRSALTTDEGNISGNTTNIGSLTTALGKMKANLAGAYDSTETYAVGDLCIRSDILYRCSTAITTAEDWTAAHWTQTTVEDELAAILAAVVKTTAQMLTDAEKQQARTNIGAAPPALKFEDVEVAASSFVSDVTYTDYPYRAAVALTGVTAAMVPWVAYDAPEAASGSFAPVAEAYAGGVYLYASEVPSDAITIPTILCWRWDA